MSAVIDKPPFWRTALSLFKGFDGWLALAILLLMGIGLTAMYSSGFDHGTRFVDHGRNMLLAWGIILTVAMVPQQRLQQLALPLYTLGAVLLVAVLLFGITKKGATRWINIGIVIQPSELLKIAAPMMLAWWFQRREGTPQTMDYVIAFGLLLLPVGLIMKQPDLGTALLVLMTGASVIFFAGLSWKLVLPPIILGAIAITLLVWNGDALCQPGVDWHVLHEYQRQRVCTLLDPTRDPLGKGFHILQGMIAIGSGGVWGKGFMQGTQTHLEFIPERTTDFIFAAYSEEFGFLGNIVLLLAFIFLVARIFIIAAQASTRFGRLMAGSIGVMFFTYSFVNMGMVSGILPVVGVPLPFISYGGTAMVTLGLSLGILFSIARDRRTFHS